MIKILLIGPRVNKKEPQKTGGTIVLFEQFINDLSKRGIRPDVIDTNLLNYKNKLQAITSIFFSLLKKAKHASHISLHGTVNNFLFFAPAAIIISHMMGKTVSLRKFAGNFNLIYEQAGKLKRVIIKSIIKHADYTFFETKYLVEYFGKWNKNTYWFPNVRSKAKVKEIPRKFHKRFVFISHVSREKGIDILLKASLALPSSYTLDIYGPIINEQYTIDELQKFNVNYRGALEHSQVLSTLSEYDVLLLPSFREGYPGIIIEAYSLGIPVITTALQSILEICSDEKEGILIEPGNAGQLISAIKYFNNQNYSMYSENAYRKFELFNSESYTSRFLEIINSGLKQKVKNIS